MSYPNQPLRIDQFNTAQTLADGAFFCGYSTAYPGQNIRWSFAQLQSALGGNLNYQGTWDASTNTPTLANPPATATKGYYYVVSVAGTQFGLSFNIGDWIV